MLEESGLSAKMADNCEIWRVPLMSGEIITNCVGNLLVSLGYRRECTLEELEQRTGKELWVFCCGVNCDIHESAVWLSPRRSAGAIAVAAAVTASMSLPFAFPACAIGKLILRDGGMLNNFPIHVFPGKRTLGLTIALSTVPREGALTRMAWVMLLRSCFASAAAARVAQKSGALLCEMPLAPRGTSCLRAERAAKRELFAQGVAAMRKTLGDKPAGRQR